MVYERRCKLPVRQTCGGKPCGLETRLRPRDNDGWLETEWLEDSIA